MFPPEKSKEFDMRREIEDIFAPDRISSAVILRHGDEDDSVSLTAPEHVTSVYVPTDAGDVKIASARIDPDKIYGAITDDIGVRSILDPSEDFGLIVDMDDEIREAYARKRGAIRGKALKEEVHEVYKKADMLDEMNEIFKKWYPDEEFTVETFQKLGKMIVQDTVKEICELIGGYGSVGEAEKELSQKMKSNIKSKKGLGEVQIVSELLLLQTLIDKYHVDEGELPEEGRIKIYRGRDMFNTYEGGLLDVLKEINGVK